MGVPSGSLTVVGTGIQLGVHLTPQARAAIEQADEVLYLAAEPAAAAWVAGLNPSSRSLDVHYEPGRPRRDAYESMVEEILAAVRAGREVCAAFYGHPGVFVAPAHEAIRRARREGFEATMLPGISAEDCLFADLGLEPGRTGWQSYEGTDFLLHRRRPDTAALLILWQISVIGRDDAVTGADRSGLCILAEYLGRFYPPAHETIVYEASPYPVADPSVQRIPLAEVRGAEITPLATLVVPPKRKPRRDLKMVDRLGLPRR